MLRPLNATLLNATCKVLTRIAQTDRSQVFMPQAIRKTRQPKIHMHSTRIGNATCFFLNHARVRCALPELQRTLQTKFSTAGGSPTACVCMDGRAFVHVRTHDDAESACMYNEQRELLTFTSVLPGVCHFWATYA